MALAVFTFIDESMRGKTVLLKTDNMATAMVLQSGRGRDPMILQAARDIWYHEAIMGVKIIPIHAPGSTLTLADALSRRPISPQHVDLSDGITSARGLVRVYVDPFALLTHYDI